MSMENNNVGDIVEKLLCFEPDLEGYEFYVNCFYNKLISHAEGGVWTQFCTSDEFVDYCRLALRAYAHLSNNVLYSSHGFKTESLSKLKNCIHGMYIPEYVLDMMREICRRMYIGEDADLVAYFPLEEIGTGLVPGLGLKPHHLVISSLLCRCFPTISMKSVGPEICGKSPAFVSSDASLTYSNGSMCPAFRTEAVNMLRFIRPWPRFYVGYTNSSRVTADVSPWNATQLSSVQIVAPKLRDSKVYDRQVADSSLEIIDAHGVTFKLDDFVEFDRATLELAHSVTVNGSQYLPTERPNVNFHYGNFSSSELHSIVRAFALNDAIMSDRNRIRGVFNFGSAFRHDVVRVSGYIEERFPSNLNPSKPELLTSKILGAGKQRKKGNKARPRAKSIDLNVKKPTDKGVDELKFEIG